MGLNQFVLGFVVALLFVGCAAATFPYKYYGTDLPEYKGWLRAPAGHENEDLDFKECAPNGDDKSPCTVVRTVDFDKIKMEYIDMEDRLIRCERGR